MSMIGLTVTDMAKRRNTSCI